MPEDQSDFALPVLQAINDWQRGGDAQTQKKRGIELKQQCLHLPDRFRVVSLVCFRQIALEKKSVWDLLGKAKLQEKISSWTLDISVAKTFKGGVPPDGAGFQGVIFALLPKSTQVVVNLAELYRDPDFIAAVERQKSEIRRFADGIGRYWDSQSEVVLEISELQEVDIYSMGGHSSSFDELVHRAAQQIYRRQPTQQEFDSLRQQVNELEVEAGARWMDQDSTRRVLGRMEQPLHRLRKIKESQDMQQSPAIGTNRKA